MNIETVVNWLNNNPDVLAVIAPIGSSIIGFIFWLLKRFLSRNTEAITRPQKHRVMDSTVHMGRDINAGRDIIGVQHNVADNIYLNPKSNNNQPIIDVNMETFSSRQGRRYITLSFKNIGNNPGIVYDLRLANQRLQIHNFTLSPNAKPVAWTFDISGYKVLHERYENAVLEMYYKNLNNELGKTIAKAIQCSRADGGFNIKGLEIVEYLTPDRYREEHGGMIILGNMLNDRIWDKKF